MTANFVSPITPERFDDQVGEAAGGSQQSVVSSGSPVGQRTLDEVAEAVELVTEGHVGETH
jgi:hypothetical protein